MLHLRLHGTLAEAFTRRGQDGQILLDEDLYERLKLCTQPAAKNWLFSLEEQSNEAGHVEVIWKARRDIIFEGKFQAPFATCGFITSYMDELSVAAYIELQPKT